MKKLFAIVLAVAMLASMATVASAAETTTTRSTTLTTTVPAATYTLNIPEDQEIPYGDTWQNIGPVTITDGKGFAVGKNIKVSVTYTEFTSETVSTTIPFTVCMCNSGHGGNFGEVSSLLFKGKDSGGVAEYHKYTSGTYGTTDYKTYDIDMLAVLTKSEDWGKALAGEYSATITFSAEVVVEN